MNLFLRRLHNSSVITPFLSGQASKLFLAQVFSSVSNGLEAILLVEPALSQRLYWLLCFLEQRGYPAESLRLHPRVATDQFAHGRTS